MANLTPDQRWAVWLELNRAAYNAAHEPLPPDHALLDIWYSLPSDQIVAITDILHDYREAARAANRAVDEASKYSQYALPGRYQEDGFEFGDNEASFFDYMAAVHRLNETQTEFRDAANTLAYFLEQRILYYNGLQQARNYAYSLAHGAQNSWQQTNKLYSQAQEDLVDFKSIFEQSKKYKLRASAASQFPSNWCGSWDLASGSFGTASVWVKTDSHMNVVDRVVVKDSYGIDYVGTSNDAWHDPELWIQDPTNPTRKLPNEIVAMLLLRGREGSENIVRIRGYRLRAKEMFTRIFMEFAPFGDCNTFCHRNHPPESFVWAAFEALAIAGLLMAHGEMQSSPGSGWWPIIHRDLKPDNLLLGLPLESRYRGYPSIKLADFGLSLIIDPNNPPDPESLQIWGTMGCKSPEHEQHVFKGEDSARAMDERTNVWEVGNTIWQLIAEYYPTYDFDDEKARMPDIEDDRDRLQSSYQYSRGLRETIMWAMAYRPERRPNFHKLLAHIRATTGQGWMGKLKDASNGLREAPSSAEGFQDPRITTLYDKFALNTKLQMTPSIFGRGTSVGNTEEEFGGLPGSDIRMQELSQGLGATVLGSGSRSRQSRQVGEGAGEQGRSFG
ncbi:kinase-like protein [Teratosphaeria nubilosa]|uniref:non-specific serine/threonine protein kinase n=1 Tax=Teratosphaeria nubilosa TaxID=161662 RepID=A0A6G1L7C6_9PEZI|nr:kinase-like protein [Teratosphaeria nubilosa]